MNFLAHDFILPPGSHSLTRIGSALPDLWSWLPRRLLPLKVLRSLEAQPTPEARELAVGITSHMKSDAAFHRHLCFEKAVDQLTASLRPVWPGLRHPSMAAHVLFEMLLDRWLIQQRPGLVDDYYSAFSASAIARASMLSAPDDEPARADLESLMLMFASSAFLADYRGADGLAMRFVRALRRVPFPIHPEPVGGSLAALVEHQGAALSGLYADLLEVARLAASR